MRLQGLARVSSDTLRSQYSQVVQDMATHCPMPQLIPTHATLLALNEETGEWWWWGELAIGDPQEGSGGNLLALALGHTFTDSSEGALSLAGAAESFRGRGEDRVLRERGSAQSSPTF